MSRLAPHEHTDLPWRVAEITEDFDLIDAWRLPAEGDLSEFNDLKAIFANLDPGTGGRSATSRALFAIRYWLGERFDWDESVNTLPIPGCAESSLRDRLPPDLVAETDNSAEGSPFRPIYATDTEWALELSNNTVHAVLHLGWAEQTSGHYRGQMGVYVKPRGRLGGPYMTLIAPFRHYIVYPAMLGRIDERWKTRSAQPE